jgi:hypothetical protein
MARHILTATWLDATEAQFTEAPAKADLATSAPRAMAAAEFGPHVFEDQHNQAFALPRSIA